MRAGLRVRRDRRERNKRETMPQVLKTPYEWGLKVNRRKFITQLGLTAIASLAEETLPAESKQIPIKAVPVVTPDAALKVYFSPKFIQNLKKNVHHPFVERALRSDRGE